jgi:FkbM family methyltransferase
MGPGKEAYGGSVSQAIWGVANFRVSSLFGRLLRWPLKLIPKGSEIRVMSGPLKGMRWITDASNATCWLGVYENDKQRAMQELMMPGQVMFDLGANVGFYTLIGSRMVGDGGRVIAFEPARRNLPYLHRHLALNNIKNCEVIEAAVSSKEETVFFDVSTLPVSGHISQNREQPGYEVLTVVLDDLVNAGKIPPPDVIKCDIEGAEYEALIGTRQTLRKYRPTIVLATHGAEVHGRCCELLKDLGYEVTSLSKDKDVNASDELIARPLLLG